MPSSSASRSARAAPPRRAPTSPVPASAQPGGVRHEYQRLNNCGPVTIGMAMSYWGGTQNQYAIAPVLKPNKADKNVGPDELAGYARKQGYAVHLGVADDLKLVGRLVAAGFPVIVETCSSPARRAAWATTAW